MMRGIDVSDNQGYIDWKKVKAAGVEFVILRTTRGSGTPDKYLPTNIKGCMEAGIPISFYKYMYATTNSKAKEEALRVVEVLKSYGIAPDKKVKIWADVEDATLMALSTQALTEIVDNFKEIIVNSGYSFGLYMGKYNYESNELDVSKFNDDLWIARYYNGYNSFKFTQDPNEAYKPVALAGELWGWQYTSSGTVDGINGNVDLDISYYDFEEISVEPKYYDTPEFTLIDCLNKIGADSSYSNRKKIAIANGIQNYSGTAAQNTEMITLLNSGYLKKA